MVEELKEREQNQPTEEQMIIQRLRNLGLSIPSEELYDIIRRNREAYIVGKYELLKEIYNNLIWKLEVSRAEVSGASVVYKKGLELNPESILFRFHFLNNNEHTALLFKFRKSCDSFDDITISCFNRIYNNP